MARPPPLHRGLLDSVPTNNVRGATAGADPGHAAVACSTCRRAARFASGAPARREICAPTPEMLPRSPPAAMCRALPPSARLAAAMSAASAAPASQRSGPTAAGRACAACRSASCKSLDVAARIGNLLGAGMREESRARRRRRRPRDPARARSSASSANRAAANRRWDGSLSGSCRSPAANAPGEARAWPGRRRAATAGAPRGRPHARAPIARAVTRSASPMTPPAPPRGSPPRRAPPRSARSGRSSCPRASAPEPRHRAGRQLADDGADQARRHPDLERGEEIGQRRRPAQLPERLAGGGVPGAHLVEQHRSGAAQPRDHADRDREEATDTSR